MRGFTLRECARRAQVSHAAPAHHFASIDDLLAEIATRGYHDLAAAMTAEARRSGGDAAARLVGQGVGYMAFAAANPVLFQLMFSREANHFETPALAAAAKSAYHLHREAVEAVIPQASADVKERMVDFAWADGARLHHPGPRRPDRRAAIRRARSRRAGWRTLSAMAETVCGPAAAAARAGCLEQQGLGSGRRPAPCGSASPGRRHWR